MDFQGTKPLAHVQKPIHELRKEAGSLINEQFGLHAASLFLGHSDTRITAAHYVDKKKRISISLGKLLPQENFILAEKI